MAEYCNITTDLQRLFSRIEDYQAKEIVENWTSVGSGVYSKIGTGYVSGVIEDNNVVYTAVTNQSVDAGEYYYNADIDKLYIKTDGEDDPADHTIEVVEDWDSFKTNCRNQAQEMVDSMMNRVYPTPLMPRNNNDHVSTVYYEYPIVRATAALTCYLIISRVNPADPNAMAMYKIAINPNPEPGEMKGILNQYVDGDIVRQDQITSREVGNWNIQPYTSNSVSVWPQFFGKYTGHMYKQWKVEIDTAGVVGTATYKVSYDGGTNWDLTGQDTKDATDDEYRMYIADGVYVYWPAASYGLGDYWTVHLYPQSDGVTVSRFGSIPLTRR